MASYETIDFLFDLEPERIDSAQQLSFTPYVPPIPDSVTGWDNQAEFSTSQDYALLKDNFFFEGKEGATYDIYSSSFFDPFILLLYDNQGNVIAYDKGDSAYGSDSIFNFVAPYSGKYFTTASWDQGSAASNKFVYLSVHENIDTIPKSPPTSSAPAPTSRATSYKRH